MWSSHGYTITDSEASAIPRRLVGRDTWPELTMYVVHVQSCEALSYPYHAMAMPVIYPIDLP